VFILAPSVGVLFAGRILSGLSAGLMTGTATATLTELIPSSASRRACLAATAVNMGGLGIPALAPTFVGSVMHQPSHAIQGGVVFLLLAVGAITQLLLARFNSRRVVGAVFLGSLATANRLAPAGHRGQAISTYFVLCYTGLIIPSSASGWPPGSSGTSPPCSHCPSCSLACACSPSPASAGPC
jgi:predicted MFS family arabinose efflux permease